MLDITTGFTSPRFMEKEGQRAILDMLREDHAKVKKLFEEFENTTNSRSKQRIINETLRALQIHAALEEEVVYPAFRGDVEEDLMNEAVEEHHVMHLLLDEIGKLKAGDPQCDAKFTVLAENVRHHIREEEGKMFPDTHSADIDWDDLHERVMKKRRALEQSEIPLPGGRRKKTVAGKRAGTRKMTARPRRKTAASKGKSGMAGRGKSRKTARRKKSSR